MLEDCNLKEEFENRINPIILEPHEICPYKYICPFANLGNPETQCFGTRLSRDCIFVCDIIKLKE